MVSEAESGGARLDLARLLGVGAKADTTVSAPLIVGREALEARKVVEALSRGDEDLLTGSRGDNGRP